MSWLGLVDQTDSLAIDVVRSEVVSILVEQTREKITVYELRLVLFPKKVDATKSCLFYVRKQRYSVLRSFHAELYYHCKITYGIQLPKFPSRHVIDTILGSRKLTSKREVELNTYYTDLCTLTGTKLLEFTCFREFFEMDAQNANRDRARSVVRSMPPNISFRPNRISERRNFLNNINRNSGLNNIIIGSFNSYRNANNNRKNSGGSVASDDQSIVLDKNIIEQQKRRLSDSSRDAPALQLSRIGRATSFNFPPPPSDPAPQLKKSLHNSIKSKPMLSQSDPIVNILQPKEEIVITTNVPQIKHLSVDLPVLQALQLQKVHDTDMDISTTLYIDFGSKKIRAARYDTSFDAEFPAIIGRPRSGIASIAPDIYKYEFYVGHDVLTVHHRMYLHQLIPKSNGHIQDHATASLLLEHVAFRHNNFRTTTTSPDVVVIVTDLPTSDEKTFLSEWMLNDWQHTHTLGFSHFCILSQQTAALNYHNLTTGIVIHLGEQRSSVSFIYENSVTPHIAEFGVTGSKITEALMAYMHKHGVYVDFFHENVSEWHQIKFANNFKKKKCFCAGYAAVDDRFYTGAVPSTIWAMSPFDPTLIGLDCIPLQQVVVNLISQIDDIPHEQLFESIVIFGSTSNFPGLIQHLESEITRVLDMIKLNVKKVRVLHCGNDTCILEGAKRFSEQAGFAAQCAYADEFSPSTAPSHFLA